MMSGSKYKVFNKTIRGHSHIKEEKICEDYSIGGNIKDSFFATVADGHGGEDYFRSDKGSKLACICAEECLKDFINNIDLRKPRINFDEIIVHLGMSIISLWNDRVLDDIKKNPFSDLELDLASDKLKDRLLREERREVPYGTTLIVALKIQEYIILMQVGDGNIVLIDSNNKGLDVMEEDENCFLNATTSLCDSNVIKNFRYKVVREEDIKAIFIGTDGIDNSFTDKNQLFNFYLSVLSIFETKRYEEALDEVMEFLPNLSKRGSRDDISMAGVIKFDENKGFLSKLKNNLWDFKRILTKE